MQDHSEENYWGFTYLLNNLSQNGQKVYDFWWNKQTNRQTDKQRFLHKLHNSYKSWISNASGFYLRGIPRNVRNSVQFHAMYGIQSNSTLCTEFRAIPRNVRNSEQFHAIYGIQSNSTQCTEFRAIPRNVRNSQLFHAMYGIERNSTQCTEFRAIPRNVRNHAWKPYIWGVFVLF